MEHRTSAELNGFAAVIRPEKLSRKELLERWALALEKRKGARLRTLRETEYKPVKEQLALREENSPLTVAFEDPVLRSAGLTSDTFGEVARFFGLSHWQLHDVVCNCHFGEAVAAEAVAARVRRLSGRTSSFATFAYTICNRHRAFGRNCFAEPLSSEAPGPFTQNAPSLRLSVCVTFATGPDLAALLAACLKEPQLCLSSRPVVRATRFLLRWKLGQAAMEKNHLFHYS